MVKKGHNKEDIFKVTYPYVFNLHSPIYSMRTDLLEDSPSSRQNKEFIKHKLEESISSPLKGDLCMGIFYTKSSKKMPDVDNVLGIILDAGNRTCWLDDCHFKDIYIMSSSTVKDTFTTILIAKHKLRLKVYERLRNIRNNTIRRNNEAKEKALHCISLNK